MTVSSLASGCAPARNPRRGRSCQCNSKRIRATSNSCGHCVVRKHKAFRDIAPRPKTPQDQQLASVPLSKEGMFCAKVATVLDDLYLHKCWCAFVPSRLGVYNSLDAVAEVFRTARIYHAGGRQDTVVLALALRSYSKAASKIQLALDDDRERFSDGVLLALALLSLCEIMLKNSREAYATHYSGIAALLLSRPAGVEMTDVSRTILFAMWDRNSRLPCTQGTPSPFDEERWLQQDPAGQTTLPIDAARIRKLSHQLLIKLPRLIAMVRHARTNWQEAATADTADTADLAKRLLILEDEHAENLLLHRLGVVKTDDPFDRAVVSFSFEFHSPEDLTAAIMYWKARLMLVRLCQILLEMGIISSGEVDFQHLNTQQRRMAKNVIMSWQYACSRGLFGVVTLPQALVAVWGAVAGVDCRPSDSALRDWLSCRFYSSLGQSQPDDAEEHMSEASDMFAGGPLCVNFMNA